ncbi:beta-galactosidase [Pullulanibacillus pueri]|uniref:Beta-galactosidase n=1 Tax=Pullulanibacillus pueri TaxID=1437324 RepID=A0A8J3EKM6_9BACL|nr:beta-galactosidase [Pullulanibacillus pueri]MBM7679930.1 beta-galactosidase [Pullulanibacillus pueri]GGH73542.1 beta-galactosidase [Pullulanibacillus pueri]
MAKLSYRGNQFIYDEKPIQIISGAIHYFRVVPEYWEDRLLKLKACGFNTVETYVPWNVHEPNPDEFNFEGMADVVQFIETAASLDLHVIVRPSPYICAEWEFGGLPAWLLADDTMRIRSSDKRFLKRVDRYYDVLMEKLGPLLSTNGGPIIAMQIENEYGSYGNDLDYLTYLKEAMIKRGIDVLLFTSDGPTDFMLQGGTVPGILATVNFGSRATEAFDKLEEYRPGSPKVCMEFWNGWFDHWGEKHHTREPHDAAKTFDEMMQAGASVNFYMFHGGTNFGFYSGANMSEHYEPTITSYDYDSLLSEAGDVTPKFHAVRKVLASYQKIGELKLPDPIPKRAYGAVKLTENAQLFASLEQLSQAVERTHPEPMEKLGQNYGFILYRTKVSGPKTSMTLNIREVHDRSLIFLDGSYQGVIERGKPSTVVLDIPEEGGQLDVLVENMGRINYGPQLRDRKGVTEGIQLGQQFLYNWTIYALPLEDVSPLVFEQIKDNMMEGPGFFKGTFNIDDIGDTFLELEGWTKGVAFINGFNLGRYWEIGPQKTLYVPGPLLKKGENDLVIFELHGTEEPVVRFRDSAVLG